MAYPIPLPSIAGADKWLDLHPGQGGSPITLLMALRKQGVAMPYFQDQSNFLWCYNSSMYSTAFLAEVVKDGKYTIFQQGDMPYIP